MMSPSDLSNVISDSAGRFGLKTCRDLHEPGWTFWELRTLNRHRMVGFLGDLQKPDDAQALESEVRGAVSRNFKRAWWRGFAYGVVLEVRAIPSDPTDLERLVDVYENRKGVLQWAVLVAEDGQTAIGVHTWMETYLSPIYRDVLQALTTAGYHVTTAVRGKDGLLKFLTRIAETRGIAFPEFHSGGSG
jgi:hypothetical protein